MGRGWLGRLVVRVNFKKIGLKDPLTIKFQDNVRDMVSLVNTSPFISGEFHEVDVTATGNFKIYTGLGRAVQGWIITDRTPTGGTAPNGNMHRILDEDNGKGVLTLNCPTDIGLYKFWVF